MTPSATGSATPLLASVLNNIGRRIISGELPEGRTFTLQDISDRFAISRTVARETMRALEQLGLVSSSRRVGITVLSRAHWAVFDPTVIDWRLETEHERPLQLRALTELRIAIEPIAAYNAATSATEEQRQELVELAATLRRLGDAGSGDTEAFLTSDLRFHTLLMESSGNDMFMALSPSLDSALRGRTQFGLQPKNPDEDGLAAHENLAQAIAEGRADDAESAARTILKEVREALSNGDAE